jgi:Ca-activated chloride channel family protein
MEKKRRDAFAEHQFHEQLFEKVQGLQNFSCLISFGTLFLIFSIIDLLSGSNEVETNQRLNNVIFMLDVSNSMNAEDVEPNRLMEAKM